MFIKTSCIKGAPALLRTITIEQTSLNVKMKGFNIQGLWLLEHTLEKDLHDTTIHSHYSPSRF